uniref:E3 ubiquitin-protein ligase n=1 Tax=Caenorhabditis japonica TaxID=281687 RepID=A0A8R1DYU6_CAEJA
MVLPTSVPSCGHKFCFICLKGVNMANLGGCPICRGPIDASIFKKPSQNLDLKMTMPNSPVSSARVVPVADEDVEDVKPDVSTLNGTTSNGTVKKNFWLYEGRNSGWWRFDPRIEKDIEEAFVNQMPLAEVIVCGLPYIIDFSQMKQYPKNDRNTCRAIRRVDSSEFDTLNVKGLAGVLAK